MEKFDLNLISQEVENFKLKKVNYEYLEHFYQYSLNKDLYRYLEFDPFTNLEECEKYILKLINRIKSGQADYRFIFRENILVGLFGFHNYDKKRNSVEYGYGVSPEFQNQGIFKIVTKFFLKELFSKTTIHRIFAITSVENEASKRSLESVGFNYEGCMRDYYLVKDKYVDANIYGIVN